MIQTILKKCLYVFLFAVFAQSFLYAHASAERENELTIYGIRGSSGVGLIRLFEEAPNIAGFNVRVEALANQDLMAGRFISGEAQFGILPPNMAAKIAAIGGVDIRAAAVIGAGMLSLLSTDPAVHSISDLRGRTVEVAGQGATPDFVFRRILRSHGMDPNRDLTLGYALAPPEIAQSLIAGRVSTALLPEPFVTMARMGRPDLRVVSDIQAEWRAGGIGDYPMTLLVVQGAFADANPAAVETILNAARNSIEWVTAHPAEAGLLVEKHELGLRASIVTAAIPNSNYVFIPALQARPSLEALFRVFLEYDPVSIGGVLPDNKFYYR